MEQLYLRYQPVVHSLAHKMSKKYRRPYDEVHEIGNDTLKKMVCEQEMHEFDRRKSQMITWLYTGIYWSMVVQCERRHARRCLPLDEKIDKPYVDGWLDVFLRELSTEAQVLVRVCCEAPGELASLVSARAPVRSQNAIRKYFGEVGWGEVMLEKAWKEVEVAL